MPASVLSDDDGICIELSSLGYSFRVQSQKTRRQIIEETLDKYCPLSIIGMPAESSLRDYMNQNLSATESGSLPIPPLVDEALLEHLHLSGQSGRELLHRINDEIKKYKPSDIRPD
jgi:hypothetical protein